MDHLSNNSLTNQVERSQPSWSWDDLSAWVCRSIAEELDLATLLNTTCDRVRGLLQSDRVLIYELVALGHGQLKHESVAHGNFSLQQKNLGELWFEEDWLQPYTSSDRQDQQLGIVDGAIYSHGRFLEEQGDVSIVENVVIPIVAKSERWGLLIIQNCLNHRPWSPQELRTLTQITVQLAIAIHQANLVKQLQTHQLELTHHHDRRIIDLEQANQKLALSEKKYRYLIDNLHAGFVLHAADTSIILCNENACKLLGLTLDQMMGKTAIDLSWSFCCEDESPMALEDYPVNQVIKSGEALRNYVLKINRSDHSFVWVLVNAFPEFNVEGVLEQIAITFIDITQFKEAKKTLEQVSQRLFLALKSGAIGCWDWDIKNNMVLWDDRMYELYGVQPTSDTVVYDTWANGVHPEDIESVENILQQTARGEAEYDVEFRVIHPDDQSIHYIKAYGVLVRDSSGNPQSVIGINYDITQTKQIQENLERLSNRLSLALKSGAIGCWDWDLIEDVITWDDRMYELYGVEQQEGQILYDVWANALHPDDLVAAQKLAEQAIAEEKEYDLEFRVVHPNSSIHFIKAHGVLVKDMYGQVTGMIGINFDITNRKRAELENLEIQNFLNSIIENIPDMIFVKEAKKLTFARFNKAGESLLGYSREQLIGKSDRDFFPPDEAEQFIAKDRQVLEGGQILEILEETIKTHDGETRILHTKKIPILDELGQPKYLLGISEDITDRKLKEKALEESELRFQKISKSSPAGIYIHVISKSGGHYFEYVSAAFETIFELTPEVIMSDFDAYQALVHPDDIADQVLAIRKSVKDLSPFEHRWRIITPSKKVKWLQAHARPEVRPNGDIAFHGVVSDITPQIEGQERLVQIAHHIPGMIYQYCLKPDGSSYFPYASDGIIHIYGVTPEQAKEDAAPIIDAIHPDDREDVMTSIEQSAKNLTTWHCEYRVCLPNGQTNWLFGHSSPQLEPDGSVLWFGHISDISDRKEVELNLAEAKEAAEAATKAKSQFLANMSHEIRTPMNGVLGMAELLSTTGLSDEQEDFVQTIQDSGNALLVIINDILDFSKIESGMLQLEEHPFHLSDVVNSVCGLLRAQAEKEGIVLKQTIAHDLPKVVLGDKNKLRQILLNLVGNAIKFTHQGSVSIEVQSDQSDPSSDHDPLDHQPHHPDGDIELLITIQDSGIGINDDRLQQLFQPFTQADTSISRKYGGTGLGLAISKSLVELMHGTIWVESGGNVGGNPPPHWRPDPSSVAHSGCKFYLCVKLKTKANSLQAIEEEAHGNVSQNGAEDNAPSLPLLNILIAEDNLFNQKVVTLMLKKLGYTPDITNNGVEVLRQLEKKCYDLILMDMQMPEMDGITTTQIIRQSSQPQPHIVALTANALEEDRVKCLEAGMDDFMTKPIPMKLLKQLIEKGLEAKSRHLRSSKG
jgi:PAS domain S-box-containing protein